jgi:hypothetical protein
MQFDIRLRLQSDTHTKSHDSLTWTNFVHAYAVYAKNYIYFHIPFPEPRKKLPIKTVEVGKKFKHSRLSITNEEKSEFRKFMEYFI